MCTVALAVTGIIIVIDKVIAGFCSSTKFRMVESNTGIDHISGNATAIIVVVITTIER
ncbi:Uncharacterised protein [Vibrio cholerae]|uniref:Uncharacterized protein n=1 Tax=Vibrio cholerae TaxID=666 RepID=A0A655SBZ1_VIBCL|nr:Uncharacterised protein [Vibrio cholerae]CSB22659.1 Uncharacterised protein [Vibrio cholerae]CSC54339.1 Uncharacterised protein [Vibrio cholerae]CSC84771.1 Uncharacterised protein [Vibrio cholerae]